MEWLQFSIYIEIVSCNKPHYRVVDLLAYQHLVIQAYQEYHRNCRLDCDHRFHQRGVAIPSMSWSTTDPTFGAWPFQAEPAKPFASTASAHPTLQETINWTQAVILPTTRSPILHPKPSDFPAKQDMNFALIGMIAQFLDAITWLAILTTLLLLCVCVTQLWKRSHTRPFLSKQSIHSWPQTGILQWCSNTFVVSANLSQKFRHIAWSYPVGWLTFEDT